MQRDATDTLIMEAAQLEFARRGFHKTVVSDIADRAGVGKGTVYRRFGNKEELFGTLIKSGSQELQARISEVMVQAGSAREALAGILDVHFDFFDNSREIIEIIIVEGMQLTKQSRVGFVRELANVRSLFADFFARGIREGVFVASDPDKLAMLFYAHIWSILRGAVIFREEDPRRNYRSLMLEVFLHGVEVRPNPGGARNRANRAGDTTGKGRDL
jgi:AcrR family transcriptional regulator